MKTVEDVVLERYGLVNNQQFDNAQYTQLHWGITHIYPEQDLSRALYLFGFGDLRDEDLNRIQTKLRSDTVFSGWNDHDGDIGQDDHPVVIVGPSKIIHRPDILSLVKEKQ